MIFGVGIDLIEVGRLEKEADSGGDTFLGRVFTSREIEYCREFKTSALNYAARFAAKEATLKAMGTGLREGFQWKDIEVLNDDLGKPYLNVQGRVKDFLDEKRIRGLHLSLSHLKQFAVACVVLEAAD